MKSISALRRMMVESTCVISMDKEGNWFYNGSAVTNENIALYFARHLDKDGKGGFILRTERQVWPIEVEDTPYIIKKIKTDNVLPGLYQVILNDGTSETVTWEDIRLVGESALYCRVKNGQFEARFNSNSQFALADLLGYDVQVKKFYREENGKRHYLSVFTTKSKPGTPKGDDDS